MERHAFAMKVKEGKMNDYRKTLGEIWPELTAYLDRNGIHNFSIWNAADLIFGYYENADGAVISPKEEKVKAALTEKIQDTFTWISTPGKDMRLMYHNFGVVRENKELIRHRMFMPFNAHMDINAIYNLTANIGDLDQSLLQESSRTDRKSVV